MQGAAPWSPASRRSPTPAQTDELRAEAAKVRRALRLGAKPQVNGGTSSVDLDALLAALTAEQQALLAAKINAPTGPGTGPKKQSPEPVRIPATGTAWDFQDLE